MWQPTAASQHHTFVWFYILFVLVHLYLVFYDDYIDDRHHIVRVFDELRASSADISLQKQAVDA